MRRFGRPSKAAEEPSASSTSSIDPARLEAIFEGYSDAEDPEWMMGEGLEKLCTEMEVDAATDVRALALAWKLKSGEKPGAIRKSEFVAGMQALRSDSIAELKRQVLHTLDPGFMEHKEFREFYRFCFKFNREDAAKKTIEKDIVMVLLPMVMSNRSQHTDKFVQFLGEAPKARVSHDEWSSFLEFSKEFSDKDISAYEDDGAWPSLLDDFIEWLRSKA